MELKLPSNNIVSNVRIYDLDECFHAAGYPMRTSTEWEETRESELKRSVNLSHAADWQGAHDQFLTGIRVSFDLTFTNKAWVEAERYRFLEFVSSQSTMHRITKFDLRSQYNEYVDPRIIEIMEEKVRQHTALMNELALTPMEDEYNRNRLRNLITQKYLEILYSNPAGFKLTARLTTNYRCLKNIWRQRRNHRLPEWREFCKWIETLPYAKELICYEEKENEVKE
jgi:hypothetical protein